MWFEYYSSLISYFGRRALGKDSKSLARMSLPKVGSAQGAQEESNTFLLEYHNFEKLLTMLSNITKLHAFRSHDFHCFQNWKLNEFPSFHIFHAFQVSLGHFWMGIDFKSIRKKSIEHSRNRYYIMLVLL